MQQGIFEKSITVTPDYCDAASFPQKRYQTADEYARSVVFICSPANSAISGQVICVDGAMTTAY